MAAPPRVFHCLNVDAQISEDFPFWVLSQPNVDGFCLNMGHFVAAVTVTVGYSDTFADPRGCHCNR